MIPEPGGNSIVAAAGRQGQSQGAPAQRASAHSPEDSVSYQTPNSISKVTLAVGPTPLVTTMTPTMDCQPSAVALKQYSPGDTSDILKEPPLSALTWLSLPAPRLGRSSKTTKLPSGRLPLWLVITP